jgi:hypothetical protein
MSVEGRCELNGLWTLFLALSLTLTFLLLLLWFKFKNSKRRLWAALKEPVVKGRHGERLAELSEQNCSKRMVFLHHSVGQGILYTGGLFESLLGLDILTGSATYGDEIGEKTDMCDWLPKFRNSMNLILSFQNHPNRYYPDNLTNDIIMFKSCFPNSNIIKNGGTSGDAESCKRTISNYQAVFISLKEEFRKFPDKLFIYLTSPPIAPEATTSENAARTRRFSTWLMNAYLPLYHRETGLSNFLIFDLFDVLADEENYLRKEFRVHQKGDSHPNEKGYRKAAEMLLEFFKKIELG